MSSLQSAFVACALALGLSSPQGLPGQGPARPSDRAGPTVRPTPTLGAQKEIDRQKKAIEGVWRMVELRSTILTPKRRYDTAYVLVHGDFLSFELHLDWPNDRERIEFRFFESGVYRYEILEGSQLEMKALIACYSDPAGLTQFHPVGFERRYRLEVESDRMTWTGDKGQRSVFERLIETRTKRDIFGRPLPEEVPAGDEPNQPGAKKTGKKADPRDG